MFRHQGNAVKAINELKKDSNNAVAFVYEDNLNKKGTVVTIKDLFATKDAPTQASSKILEGFLPGYDAEIISRLREAEVNFVGKTHMDELALGGTGEYSAFGIINHPLDSTRIIGGSSSGAAATFTKDITMALGSDTGDSVRLPASYIGAVGYKPSYGAISRYGMFAFASSLDTVAYFTHNVSDTIETSKILFGKDHKDFTSMEVELPESIVIKPTSIGILEIPFLSKVVRDEQTKLISKLESDGIKVNKVIIDNELLEAIGVVYDVISFAEATSNDSCLNGIAFGKREGGEDWKEIMTNARTKGFGAMVQERFVLGALYLSNDNQDKVFNKAKKVRRLISNSFRDVFKENDIFIYPSSTIAPKIKNGKDSNWYSSLLSYANLIGNPSISIPFGKEEGMPFGLSIDGDLYQDKKLLSHALYIEELIGGSHE